MKNRQFMIMTGLCILLVGLCGCGEKSKDAEPVIQPIEPIKKEIAEEIPKTPSTETPEEVHEEVSIVVTATGDVTLGNYVGQDYAYSFRQAYAMADTEGYFFENVYDIFSEDDLTLVNLEGVLTNSEEMAAGRTYNIKGDPEYVNLLTYGSIEAANLANNHRLDFGEKGVRDTIEALEGAGIVYAYDSNVGIYEVKGIKIGFVGVNEVSWGQGVEKLMMDGIAELKEENVDLILACCHWGIELDHYPSDFQQKFGRECIDWGADLVIGHHPHVLQGVEEYQGKYIIYSLGNFCFGGNRNPSDKDTMIVQQTFHFVDGERGEDGPLRIIPCAITSDRTRNDYRPTPEVGEEKERILQRINEYSKGFGVAFDEDGCPVR